MKELMKEFKQRATKQGIKVTNIKAKHKLYFTCTISGKISGSHEDCQVLIYNNRFPIYWNDNYLDTVWRDERGVKNG